MKKKILSLLLAAVMVAAMIVAIPVSATEYPVANVAAVADQTAVKPGETFTVNFVITVDETVWGFFLPISFDTTRLELTKWTKNAAEFDASTTDGALKRMTGYENYTGTANANEGQYGVNAAEGVVLCTATFTVKETAPVGPAYISSMNYLPELKRSCYQPDAEHYVALTHTATYVNVVDEATGTVPAEYSVAGTTAPDSYFDFEDGVIFGFTKAGSNADIGYLVIPAEIGGVAVTAIDEAAFSGEENFTDVLIPASVTSIGQTAFKDIELATVTILNKDCAIDIGARQKNHPFNGEETVFYGIKGGAAEDVIANDLEYDFLEYAAPAATITVTANGATTAYALSSLTTKTPGAVIADGKTFLAWQIGENTYAAGADVTFEGGETIEAVMITNPVTDNGASVRVAEDVANTGIRFTAKLAKADFKALFALGDVSVGMLIAPAKYVEAAGCFTKEALGAWAVSKSAAAEDAYIDVECTGALEADNDYYTMAASLIGFTDSTIAKNIEFACVCYATVETAQGTVTVYGNYDPATKRDVKSVATAAYADVTPEQQLVLDALLAKFN